MANGSFGLSGLPSAPTTVAVDSAIKTPLTAVTVPISTSTGFQANDLVYFKNGNFGPVPDNATASATFPVSAPVATYVTGNGSPSGLTKIIDAVNTGTISLDSNQCTGITSSRVRFADKLANGNIIVVFESKVDYQAGRVVACVYSEDGTQVAGPASLGFTYEYNMVGVCALPNGNAVVYWADASNNRWTWTVVSNTLSIELSQQVLTSSYATNRNCYIEAQARSDNSVVFAYSNTTNNNIYHQIVNSTTGANVLAPTVVGTTNSGAKYYNISIAIRNDSSYVVAWVGAISNYINMNHYNSSGSILYTFTSLNNSVGTYNWGNVVTLSDGTNLLVYAVSGVAGYRPYAGLGSMGARLNYTTTGVTSISNCFAIPTTGGYLLTVSSVNQSYYYSNQALTYVYDNTNTNIGSLSFNRVSGQVLAEQSGFSGFKGTNYYHLFSQDLYGGTGFAYDTGPRTLSWSRVSLTDATNVPWTSTTASLGNTAAQPVSGYARAGSTPTAAAFFPAATGSVAYSQIESTTQATLVKTQTVIESTLVTSMDSCTLTNGNVVFIYKTTANTVKCAVYTNAGVAVTSFTVDSTTVNTSGAPRHVCICALGNGNFVVSWANTGATYKASWRIYNGTTYATIASGVNSIANSSFNNTIYYQVCAYSNNRWFMSYPSTSNYPTFELRDSTGTLLTSFENNWTTMNCLSIQAGGSLVTLLYYAGGSWYTTCYPETGTNNFGNYSWNQSVPTSAAYEHYGCKPKSNQFGAAVYHVPNTSTSVSVQQFQRNYGLYVNYNTNTGVSGTTNVNVGVTSNGDIIAAGIQSSNVLRICVFNNSMFDSSGFSTVDITGFSFYNSASDLITCMNATNGFGNQMFIGWVNASQYPTFTIANVRPQSGNVTLTAGVTVSNADLTLSPTNGYYLTGVSTGSASAGGTANVQINGSIALNSNYPSGTTYQAFDFSNPLLYGVKGTIVGRNITMQGNV